MAQIELIALDSPLVVYDRDKKENKGRVNATDANRKIAEWENKYKNKSKKVSISLEGLKMFQGNSIDDLNK